MRELSPRGIALENFDPWMTEVVADPSPWQVELDRIYPTRGGQEWGDAPWRLGDGCRFVGEGGLMLDPNLVTDEMLRSQIPIHMIPSVRGWAAGKTGEAAWASVPRNMQVSGLTFIANHSKLAKRARDLGVILRISGAVLQGHAAVIEGFKAIDFGAIGAESFPFVITGAQDGYDRHALASVADGNHVFDEDGIRSRIVDGEFSDYVSSESNNQVTHTMIVGAMCNDKLAEDHWEEIGQWHQIYRKRPLIRNVRGSVLDAPVTQNQCQLATIYQGVSGEITECRTRGYQAGAYGDFLSTFFLDVHHNDFEALRPVAFLLSPPDPKASPAQQAMPLQFSHDNVTVRSNWLRVFPTDEGWHGGVLLLKVEGGGSRHIDTVLIDDNDIVVAGPGPGRATYAVNAQGVDGLAVTPSNRIVGFREPFKIAKDCTGVVPPEIQEGFESSKGGCLGKAAKLIGR